MQLEFFKNLPDSTLSVEGRRCKVCNLVKSVDQYYSAAANKDNLDRRCKTCFKKDSKLRLRLRKEYGHLKGDTCNCCSKTHVKSLVVDHDHETLEFRGWLCEDCNLGIGNLGDDLKGLEDALVYLRKHYE
tara:strand:- start:592 stop:981 length:390 start_codon:yes stop_codon:yes gene_type:complete